MEEHPVGDQRVVVLIDMDCFYCQVEEALRPELRGKPLAVVQYNPWRGGGIIAVNYAARARGVSRHMRGDEAKEKCPELELCPVPCQRGKADITRYREAGEAVAHVLQRFTPLLERASIDEAYLDITVPVAERLRAGGEGSAAASLSDTFAVGYASWAEFVAAAAREGSGGGGGGGDSDDEHEEEEGARRLEAGAQLASEIRAAVRRETGFECSAGIAHNKVLAKLVCGINKPNKQTVVSAGRVRALYATLPLRRVPRLGGELGARVTRDLRLGTAADLRAHSLALLQRLYGTKQGRWLYDIARGVDMEPVRAKFNPKSIGCCKQFRGVAALSDTKSVAHWLRALAAELQERLQRDHMQSGRRARQLVASWATLAGGSSSRSYNFKPDDIIDANVLYSKCRELVLETPDSSKSSGNEKNCKLPKPITFLGMSAGKFEDNYENKKVKSIVDYFAAGTTSRSNEDDCDVQSDDINSAPPEPDEESHCLQNILCNVSKHEELMLKNDTTVDVSRNKKRTKFKEGEECEYQTVTAGAADDFKPPGFCSDRSGNEKLSGSQMIISNVPEGAGAGPGASSPARSDASTDIEDEINRSRCLLADDAEASGAPPPTLAMRLADDLIACPECGKTIPASSFVAHSDYHLAVRLREEERAEARAAAAAPAAAAAAAPAARAKRITSYFGRVEAAAATAATRCAECGARVPAAALPTHRDFHEAQRLSREINRAAAPPPAATPGGAKRRRPTSPHTKRQKTHASIDSFFK